MGRKICVVTWFGGENFGTTLQATALCKWFALKGFDTSILGSFRPPMYMLSHPELILSTTRSKIKYIFRKLKKAAKTNVDNSGKKNRIQSYNIDNFNVLNITTNEAWKRVLDEDVAFVTGSDQIWNPYHYNPKYMLDFARKTKLKRIAFSSSIGVNEIPIKMIGKYKRFLGGFDALSVREASAADLLEKVIGRRPKVVIDPTQLLNADQWFLFSENADLEVTEQFKDPYIFCYFVGNRPGYWDYVKKVQKQTQLKVVVIPMHGTKEVPEDFICIEGASAYEFVRAIRDASIVCTDSFHATAFSITFRKDIYILKRFLDGSKNSQNSRLYHILGKYGLQERWIEDESEFHRLPSIKYDGVHEVLQQERGDAEKYLMDALVRR